VKPRPKPKVKLAESGTASALKHNPFGALAGARAPAAFEPACATPAAVAEKHPARGRLVLRREKKHRGGKTVVVIAGFASCPALDPHLSAPAAPAQHLEAAALA
jgi:hypothetical protein